MSETPNNGIPYVPQNVLDPAAGINNALDIIDALLQTAVLSMSLTAPPGSPQDGDMYIPDSPATGAWVGLEGKLVRYRTEGALWQSFDAHLVINLADGGLYKFIDGSPGGWTLAAGLSDAPTDGEKYSRLNGTWVNASLSLFDASTSPPTEIVDIVDTIIFDGAVITEPSPGVALIELPGGAASFLTIDDETAGLPSSRRVIAGPGISFDDSVAGIRRIVNTGAFNKEWREAAAETLQGATAAITVGTITSPAKVTGGNVIGYMAKRRSTSTTAANNVASWRSGTATSDEVYAAVGGGASARAAGFYMRMQFSVAVAVAGERFFAGMALNAAEAGTVDPSALLNCLGVGKDGADTNWQFMHNDGAGAATKVDLGLAFNANNKSFVLELFVPSGGGSCFYQLTDMDTGTIYSGTVSTNLPAADTALQWRLWSSVGTTAGTAVATDLSSVGIRYPLQ